MIIQEPKFFIKPNNINLVNIQSSLKTFLNKHTLSYTMEYIDLSKHHIETLTDIESIKKCKF